MCDSVQLAELQAKLQAAEKKIVQQAGEIRETRKELSDAKRQVHFTEQRARRKENSFRLLVEHIFSVKSAYLDNGDKVVLSSACDLIMFKAHDVHDKYGCVDVANLKYTVGGLARVETRLQRIIEMGLLLQESNEHLEGQYWLAIPDDIYDRLDHIDDTFKRNWHAPKWCPICQKNVPPRTIQRTHQIVKCPTCHTVLEEAYNEKVYFLGEEKENKPLTREEFIEPYIASQEPVKPTKNSSNGHKHYTSDELIEQVETNGGRLSIDSQGTLLFSSPWMTKEQWQKARNILRPFDSEIIGLLRERERNTS